MAQNFYYKNTEHHQENEIGNYQQMQLGDLFNPAGRILKTKLEVLTLEFFQRINIKTENLSSISNQERELREHIEVLTRQANYQLRSHQEKRVFYESLAKLKQERRNQHTDCWKDIFMLMNELLEVWDRHEQVKARSQFLNAA